MGSRSLQYQAAVEYLADGKWHSYERTLRRVAEAVPPGIALRQAERLREAQILRAKGYVPPRTRPISTEDLIRSGARQIAKECLRNEIAFERDRENELVRMVPEHIRKVRAKHSEDTRFKGWETVRKAKGLPEDYVTKNERRRQMQAERALWTPEQWHEYNKAKAVKAAATRKRQREESNARLQGLLGRGGPERKVGQAADHHVRPGSADQRKGGNHPTHEEGRDQGNRSEPRQ